MPKNEKTPIETVLEWSKEVNRMVKATVFDLPPISGSLKAMNFLNPHADLVVISNTPLDTLQREWSENNIEKIKQDILKIDQLIVKKQNEMNELQKILMIEPAKINILGDTYEELRNEIKELGEKLKEHKQRIQEN